MSAFVIAVALSLASPGDYVFIRPSTTNIVGVGMGETFDYPIPRQEDHEFLREAYAERTWLNEYLSEDAVTNLNPSSFIGHPHQGVDTNSIPIRYKWQDLRLYYYNTFLDAAFDSPANCACRCAVDFDSPTISAMTVVTNASVQDARSCYPSMFVPKGSPVADRTFSTCFDTNGNLRTLVMVATPYTNAYHDLKANDALTFSQTVRRKESSVTSYNVSYRYSDWPLSYDHDGNFTWATNVTQVYSTTNVSPYASGGPSKTTFIRVSKQRSIALWEGWLMGMQRGECTFVSEDSTKMSPKSSILFSNPLGGAEIEDMKVFALVEVKHEAYIGTTNMYSRSCSVIVPVASSSPYVTSSGLTAVDLTMNETTIFSNAAAMSGESIALPTTVAGWVPESTYPSRQEGVTGIVRGPLYDASDSLTCEIKKTVGIAKLRYHARTVTSQ